MKTVFKLQDLYRKNFRASMLIARGVLPKMAYTGKLLFGLQVYERVGISLVEVYKRVQQICHLGL